MTLEERKDNTYFDQTGRQILVGDLLRVFHFKTKGKIHYHYVVVVMEEMLSIPYMAFKDYYSDKPHCKMFIVCGNEKRMYKDAKIISEQDFETKRLKLKP